MTFVRRLALIIGMFTLTAGWLTPTSAGAAPLLTTQDRINAATADAASRGATVQIAYLDRATGVYAGNNAARVRQAAASIAKVFIADELLFRESHGQLGLSPDDRGAISAMLRMSDDGAAQTFWNRFGGAAMVDDVVHRYHLGDSQVSDAWFNTAVSPADMVGYYNQLIGGLGGLPSGARDFILDQMRASTPVGADGFDQHFGLPVGLNAEPTQAIKQGWMVTDNGTWIHNSTDVIGPDSRYIVVVFSQEPVRFGEGHARDTINRVSNIIFPAGTSHEAPVDQFLDQAQHWWNTTVSGH